MTERDHTAFPTTNGKMVPCDTTNGVSSSSPMPARTPNRNHVSHTGVRTVSSSCRPHRPAPREEPGRPGKMDGCRHHRQQRRFDAPSAKPDPRGRADEQQPVAGGADRRRAHQQRPVPGAAPRASPPGHGKRRRGRQRRQQQRRRRLPELERAGMAPEHDPLPAAVVEVLPRQRPQAPARPVVHDQRRVEPHRPAARAQPPVELVVLVAKEALVEAPRGVQRLAPVYAREHRIDRTLGAADAVAGAARAERRARRQRHCPARRTRTRPG